MAENVLLIGRILQKYNLVTLQQFEEVVRTHGQLAGRMTLGELLQDKGHLTPEQVLWLAQAVRHYETRAGVRAPRSQEPSGPEQQQHQQQHQPAERESSLLMSVPDEGTESSPAPPGEAPVLDSAVRPGEAQAAVPEAQEAIPELIDSAATPMDPAAQPAEPAPARRPREDTQPPRPPSLRMTATGRVAIGILRPADGRERSERRRMREPPPGRPAEPVLVPPPVESVPASSPSSLVPEEPLDPAGGLSRLLGEALQQGASDLHLHTGLVPHIRVDGELRPLPEAPPVSAEAIELLLREALSPEQQRLLREQGDLTFAHVSLAGRLRGTAFRRQNGHDLCLRLTPQQVPTLEQLLGHPASLGPLARLPHLPGGLLLCTGPAGSGKSTTMAALVERIIRERDARVLVLGDPVEVVHGGQAGREGRSGVLCQRQVGPGTPPLARVLERALGEGWEVLGITELRDGQAAALALAAAEAGCLVLSTLLAGNATRAVERLLALVPRRQRAWARAALGGSLGAVLSQRLVRRADGGGRVLVLEALLPSRPITSLIEEDRLDELRAQMLRERAPGMKLIEESVLDLVGAGVITEDEARAQAQVPGWPTWPAWPAWPTGNT